MLFNSLCIFSISLSDLIYTPLDPLLQCIKKDNFELSDKWLCGNFNCNLIKSNSCKSACYDYKANIGCGPLRNCSFRNFTFLYNTL
ncbi:hypothetical protein PIROE2DRAFT_6609 [Piromyces sp. E2]|nr:hypothetical protein PIROE2DRAFT_6609 [Piromyces sp. E2]|eukprot:OUM66262.1 hypothetical protein PIROE2DRAFT_6609 [Piromyces sp. E2]